MMTQRTKRQTMRAATSATTIWSFTALAGLHQSAYCPSASAYIQLGVVLGNRPGRLEVGQISDQRQLHL
jgi:hypothetical protein